MMNLSGDRNRKTCLSHCASDISEKERTGCHRYSRLHKIVLPLLKSRTADSRGTSLNTLLEERQAEVHTQSLTEPQKASVLFLGCLLIPLVSRSLSQH